jgi:hypothetical protein
VRSNDSGKKGGKYARAHGNGQYPKNNLEDYIPLKIISLLNEGR